MNAIIITTFSLFLVGEGVQLYEGDNCSMMDGRPGVCKQLLKCPLMHRYLLAGNPPDTNCDWVDFMPIVCCPSTTDNVTERPATRPPPTIPSSTESIPVTADPFSFDTRAPSGPGVLAREMCDEYSKSVYALVFPPTLSTNPKPVNTSLCAVKSQKFIVGGKIAEPKEFPHMAAVGYNTNDGIVWTCGGTLVSDRFVLTAAHCTYTLDYGSAQWIRVGDLNLLTNDDDAKPQQKRVIERIRHPKYKLPSYYHDIGLLKTDSPVEFNAWVRPACLPSSRNAQYTEKAIATGWGSVEWASKSSSDLRKVTLPIIADGQCIYNGNANRLKYGIIDQYQLCAGEAGKDTCQGDSGGPLANFDQDHDCMYNVIGVTSIGRDCGSRIPGVYTRVFGYLNWLEQTIWK